MSLASLVSWCNAQMGKPYSTAPSRFGMHHFDCSGFADRGCNDNGFPLEATVTWTQQLEGERKGLTCSRDYAMNHIALCISGGNTAAGGGPNGHVAITDGSGGTWEAMGTRYGCRKGRILGRSKPFTYFMRLPGLVAQAPPKPPGLTDAQKALIAAEMLRVHLAAQEEDMHVCWLKYMNIDHCFYRMPDGTLGHMWWDTKQWGTDKPNMVGKNYAGHPEIRVAEGSMITGRTKELHRATNAIDIYYHTPDPAWIGHTWYTGSSWGAQQLAVPA